MKSYNKEEFILMVHKSDSMGHLLENLNVKKAGGNYSTMKRRIIMWDIDISHWNKTKKIRQGYRNKDLGKQNTIPLDKILVENSTYSSTYALKNRLLSENIFEYKCYKCSNTIWLAGKIPLELEHINGIRSDNRLNNLTLLCPNCHALTPTYRSKNKKKKFLYGPVASM